MVTAISHVLLSPVDEALVFLSQSPPEDQVPESFVHRYLRGCSSCSLSFLLLHKVKVVNVGLDLLVAPGHTCSGSSRER